MNMAKRILVFGGSGLVGSRFLELNKDNFDIDAPTSSDLDVTDEPALNKYLESSNAEVVLNFTGFTNVDGAEDEKDDQNGQTYKLNVLVPKNLALKTKELNKYLIHISTDYVFDGTKEDSSYTEEDEPNPVNWYGQTKLFGEKEVSDNGGNFSIIRIEMPYSAHFEKKSDFARFFYNKLKSGEEITAISDQKITPVFVDSLVGAIKVVIDDRWQGIYHIVSISSTSPFEFAHKMAKEFGFDTSKIKSTNFAQFNNGRKASRPKNSWLDVKKSYEKLPEGTLMTIDESIEEFKRLIDGVD